MQKKNNNNNKNAGTPENFHNAEKFGVTPLDFQSAEVFIEMSREICSLVLLFFLFLTSFSFSSFRGFFFFVQNRPFSCLAHSLLLSTHCAGYTWPSVTRNVKIFVLARGSISAKQPQTRALINVGAALPCSSRMTTTTEVYTRRNSFEN